MGSSPDEFRGVHNEVDGRDGVVGAIDQSVMDVLWEMGSEWPRLYTELYKSKVIVRSLPLLAVTQ